MKKALFTLQTWKHRLVSMLELQASFATLQLVAHHPSEWTHLPGSMEAPQSIKGALKSSHIGSETVIDPFFLPLQLLLPETALNNFHPWE